MGLGQRRSALRPEENCRAGTKFSAHHANARGNPSRVASARPLGNRHGRAAGGDNNCHRAPPFRTLLSPPHRVPLSRRGKVNHAGLEARRCDVNPATMPAGQPLMSVITSSEIASRLNMVAAIASSGRPRPRACWRAGGHRSQPTPHRRHARPGGHVSHAPLHPGA